MATIKLKRGTSAPTTSNIVDGEIAVDKSSQKLYIRDGSTIKELGRRDSVPLSGGTMTGSLTVGADDTGHDVKFFGATSGSYMLWDEDVDDLILAGAARIVIPDGQLVLGSTAVSSTAAELNILDGVTATATELNYSDTGAAVGTVVASKVVTADANKDASSFRNVTLTGALTAASLDISGDIDVAGGTINLGTANTSSAHINSYELMTFNIDSDNDDTDRYFKWLKNGNSGGGTELMRLDESGHLGLGSGGAVALNDADIALQVGSSSSSTPTLQLRSGTSGTGKLWFGDNSGSDAGRYDGFVEYGQTDRYMRFGTASTERMRLNATGLGIGTTSPSSLLHLEAAGSPTLRIVDTTNDATLLAYAQDSEAVVGTYSNHSLSLFANSSRALMLDSSQRSLYGHTSSQSFVWSSVQPRFQMEGTNASTSALSITRNDNGGSPPYLILAKSRGAAVNSNTIVQDDDQTGSIMFVAADGTDRLTRTATIDSFVDGTPGSNDMPGRLVFSTTQDGNVDPTIALTLDASQKATFAGSIDAAGLELTHSSDNGFKVTATDTAGNTPFAAMRLDYNASGSDTLTADRAHIGLEIDVDSSASGGDTSNEHRLYGVWTHTKATGDSDLIYGGYFHGEASQSTGTVTSTYGVFGRAESDVEGGGASNAYGAYGYATVQNDAGVGTTNAYGVYGKTLLTSTNVADAGQLVGVYGEVELSDPGSGSVEIDKIYAFQAQIDNNDTGTVHLDIDNTESYLFYGNYAGTQPGNAYGVYIVDDVPSYFGGSATFAGNITLGDGHTIGDDGDDNLVLTSSANENIMLDSGEGVYLDHGTSSTDSVYLRRAGSSYAYFRNSSDDLVIGPLGEDHNLFFQGNDGGSTINMLKLDASAYGDATFSGHAILGGKITVGTTIDGVGAPAAGTGVLGATAAYGAILTGQGSTSDVTITNDAGNTVLLVPTGTRHVQVPYGDITTQGLTVTGATDTTEELARFQNSAGSNGLLITQEGSAGYAVKSSTELELHADYDNDSSAGGSNIRLFTDASERMRITSGGDVTIGSGNNVGTAGTLDLSVGSTNYTGGLTLWSPSAAAHSVSFGDGYTGTDRYRGFLQYSHINDSLAFGTTSTEKARIDSSGRLIVGHTTSVSSGWGITPAIQIEGTDASNSAFSISRNNNGSYGGYLILGKSRGTSKGSNTIVQNNDRIGHIMFAGADGTDRYPLTAMIRSEVDGTPGANDMPGSLIFSTTSDGNQDPTDALIIDSSQHVGIGTTAPDGVLDLGNATGGRGIVWGGSSGANNYGGIWSEYSSASIIIGAGLKSPYPTTNAGFRVPYTGTYGYAAIELDSWHDDGIKFYVGPDAAVTKDDVISPTEVMRIATNGRLGLGETSPDTPVHVKIQGEPPAAGMMILEANASTHPGSRQLRLMPPTDAANGYIDYRGGNLLFKDDGTEVGRFQGSTSFQLPRGYLEVGGSVASYGRIEVFGSSGAYIDLTHATDHSGDYDSRIINDGTNTQITSKSGYIAINPQTASAVLQNEGSTRLSTTSAGITVTGSVTETSDAALKTDVQPIENALATVSALKGVTYKDKETGDKRIGFIAQDVQTDAPALAERVVSEADPETKMLGISYSHMTSVLAEAIKEQQTQIEALVGRIKELEDK